MVKKDNIKKMNKTTFCPKCKSIDVRKELNVLLVAGVPQKWICNNCGFIGYIFPQAIKCEKDERK